MNSSQQHDPITRACIYYTTNRPAITAWANRNPTLNGATITDPAQWLKNIDQWVERWRQLYKQGARKSWLCERYLVVPLRKVRAELERTGVKQCEVVGRTMEDRAA